jgi:hypothetical protein
MCYGRGMEVELTEEACMHKFVGSMESVRSEVSEDLVRWAM